MLTPRPFHTGAGRRGREAHRGGRDRDAALYLHQEPGSEPQQQQQGRAHPLIEDYYVLIKLSQSTCVRSIASGLRPAGALRVVGHVVIHVWDRTLIMLNFCF